MLKLQNFAAMVSSMAASVQSSATALLDLTVGSTLRAVLEGCASVGLWLQYLVYQVALSTRLATSTGAQCDSFGADFGFTRLPAVAATGLVTFGRYTATVPAFVPLGAQVRTADNSTTFTVIADTTNTLYSAALSGYTLPVGVSTANILVQCTAAGVQGNVLADTVTQIVGSLPYVDYCLNTTAFTNGVAAESDTAFRARFPEYLASLEAGTAEAINYAVATVGQNITSTLTIVPGFVTISVDDGTGDPSQNTLNAVAAAVAGVRAAGVTVYVVGPTLVQATVAATLAVNAATNKAAIIPAVEAAVTAYINALPMGAPLPYSRLAQVIYDANAGITNVTGLLVNGATADLGGASTQVVRALSVTMS